MSSTTNIRSKCDTWIQGSYAHPPEPEPEPKVWRFAGSCRSIGILSQQRKSGKGWWELNRWPRPNFILYRFSSVLRDSSLWSKKCETDPGAGRQAKADEGRRRRENIVQPDSSSTQSQAGLYRRRERPTYVPPSLQLVCSNFTPFAFFGKTSIESEQWHSTCRLVTTCCF